jgi:hypothetical protein
MLITHKELPLGKKGRDYLAARYCASTPVTDFKIDDSKEYAEMWMGTYPTSYVLSTEEPLQDALNANKEKLIRNTVLEIFGAVLPFLPKVLPNTSLPHDAHVVTVFAESSPWPKRFLSKSTQIKILLHTYTRKIPRNMATQTTNRRSEWRSHPLSFFVGFKPVQ